MEVKERTFTQEEVNTIVQDRLAKEKAKYEKLLADMQQDINRREKRLEVLQQLKDKNMPDDLINLVNLDNDDTINTSLALLERTYKKPEAAVIRGITPVASAFAQKPSEDELIKKAMNISE